MATVALLAAATPAFAVHSHAFSSSFGSAGSGAGEVSSPQAVAVNDSTGDVYVADTGNARVDEFDSAGAFVAAWGDDVDQTTSGDVCTAVSGDTCQAGTSSLSPGGFESPTFIAVDNSTGASAGDVYVGDTGDNLVEKFTSSGSLISSWGDGGGSSCASANGQLSGACASGGPFGSLAGIAVDPSGNLWVYDQNSNMFEFAQDGTSNQEWNSGRGVDPFGIAADSAGNLYVEVGAGNLEQFSSQGTDLGDVTVDQTGATINGAAADPSTNDIYADDGGSVIRHYDGSSLAACVPAGSCSAADSFGSENLSGTAASLAFNPATGDVYVADPGANDVDVFAPAVLPTITTGSTSNPEPVSATAAGNVDPAGGRNVTACQVDYGTDTTYGQSAVCTPATPYTSATDVTAQMTGLSPNTTYHYRVEATNAQGTSYGHDETFTTPIVGALSTGAASGVTATSATVNGSLTPGGVDTSYLFEYGTTSSYGSQSPQPPGTDAGSGTAPVAATTDLSGLLPNTLYHYRIDAINSGGTAYGQDQTFTTATAQPAVDSQSSENITSDAAELTAKINPQGSDTHYYFQYGPSTSYTGGDVPAAPGVDIGSEQGDQQVYQQLTDLQPSTIYHYRVVATDSTGTTNGPDQTFTTTAVTGPPPPDACPNAQYRTGPAAHLPDCRAYELVTPPFKDGEFPFPTPSVDDDHAVYESLGGFNNAGSSGGAQGSAYIADRTASGWVSTAVSPPASEFHDQGLSTLPLKGVNGDFTKALFDQAPTSSSSIDYRYYLDGVDGSVTEVGPVFPASALAATQPGSGVNEGSYEFDGGSDDLSHILFGQEPPPPLGGAPSLRWPGDSTVTGGGTRSLLEYVGTGNSQPILVGVDNSGQLISQCGTALGGAEPTDSESGSSVQNAVSADGSTVFFNTAPGSDCGTSGPPAREIFARINGATTVAISEPSAADCSACDTSTPQAAQFEGASSDGSKAFFLTSQPLLGGDSSQNLYEYDSNAPAGARLIRVSGGDPAGANVEGVARVSNDGSRVYYVAQGVMTSTPNSQGQHASEGANNLYVYDTVMQTTAFIAELAPADSADWAGYDARPVESTRDGEFLLFTSSGDLTPDASGDSAQLYRYDAQTGALVRVSIGENGYDDNGNVAGNNASIDGPSYTPGNAPATGAPTGVNITDDGSQVFFESSAALTPQAIASPDIYEWEQAGAGSCASTQTAGCVYLISDGQDQSQTFGGSTVTLVGASSSGSDVFFTTADQLVPQDTDTQMDLYDARVDGGFAAAQGAPTCSGDSCQGAAPPAPTPPTIATVTYTGPGNESASGAAGKARVRMLRRTIRGSRFRVVVRVPAAGVITASGKDVRSVRRTCSRATAARVTLRLTRDARRALEHHRRLRVTLRVGYRPHNGRTSTVTTTITVTG